MNTTQHTGSAEAPVWLQQLVGNISNTRDSLTGRIAPKEASEVLRNTLNDIAFIQYINSRYDRNAPDEQEKSRLLHLLDYACWIFHASKEVLSEKPSVIKKKLKQLATSADRLATELASHERILGRALDLDYLVERLSTPSPQGYSGANRGGLREALRQPVNQRVTIIDLLEALRDDVNEEISMFPHRKLDRFDGAIDARLRYQIKSLKKRHRDIYGSDDDVFVGKLILATYGATTPTNDEARLIRRIRKTKI